jgi:hypothetical protein
MDERKPRAPRGRRLVQALERLETRGLMSVATSTAAAHAPTQVGFHESTSQGYTELSITGTPGSDAIVINDNGTGSPGNVTVSYGNGQTYVAQGAISLIGVSASAGNDQITYNLTGNLVVPRAVNVNLGNGTDQYTANMNGAIANAYEFDMRVYGGHGKDTEIVNQSGATLSGAFVPYLQGGAGNDTLVYNGTGMIATGTSVTPEFNGMSGNATITSNYSGQINGNYIYNLSADGGTGNDHITANVNVAAGSTGSVGTSPSVPAVVRGGSGHDTIRFAVAVDPSIAGQFSVNAVAIGGSGKNVVTRSANVLGDKSNKKTILLG